jgi:hypothetical protein
VSDLDLTKLTDAQLGALKMVGGDLTKLPDAMLMSLKESQDGKGTLDGVMSGVNTGVNWLGTQAVKAATGLAGLPEDLNQLGMAGTRYVMDKAFGPSLAAKRRIEADQMQEPWSTARPAEAKRGIMPGSADLNRFVFGSLGLPEVNVGDSSALTLTNPLGFEGKVNVGKMLDVGMQGALSGGRGLMVPGAIAGVGSEAAGQATEGTKWELPARLLGAVTTGGAALGARSLVRKGADAVRSLPITRSGQQNLAGDIMNSAATNPGRVTSMLETYGGDAIPGVRQTAAKATGDEGLLSLENYVSGRMGSNSILDEIKSGNNAARTAHLNSLETGDVGNFVTRLRDVDAQLARDVQQELSALPPSATPAQAGQAVRQALEARRDALTTARRDATRPLYDEVAAWTAPIDARNPRIAATELVNTTKGDLQGTARDAGRTLYTAEGLPDNTAQGLVAARQDLANKGSRATTTPAEGRIIGRVRSEVDRALEESVPAARQARQEYERLSQPLEPFTRERGPSVFSVLDERRPMDPSMIPQTFLQPGERGAANVRGLQAAAPPIPGAPDVLPPMRGYVADMVRRDPQAAGNIAQTYAPALQQLDPELAGRVGAVDIQNRVRGNFQNSPMGRIAGGNDPAKEIGTILSAKDGRAQLGEMRLRAAGDPDAIQGLRQGIIDDFRQTITSKAATDSGDNAVLLSSKAKDWINKKLPNTETILTSDQRAGIRALADSLDIESRIAPKMAGSDTVRNLNTGTFLGRVLEGRIPVPFVSKWIKDAAERGMTDVYSIIAEKLADPVAARVLMMKASDGSAKIADRLLAQTARTALPAPGASNQ